MPPVRHQPRLQAWFGHLPLQVDDLLLLERFQLLALPIRAPMPALGAVLAADRRLRRFVETRCPELAPWIAEVVDLAGDDAHDLAAHRRTLVWELADWLVYQRFPGAYDGVQELWTTVEPFTEICELQGRTIVDVGAGTGRLTVALTRLGSAVFAVEPVGRLREHIARRASDAKLDNLYPLDGYLHRIPLPPGSADVLVTSRAIGWQLEDELTEVERVVSAGGWAIHLVGAPADGTQTELHARLRARGYAASRYCDETGWRQRYAKRIT